MAAAATLGTYMIRTHLAWACIIALLAISLGLGSSSSVAGGSADGVVVQQTFSTSGTPSTPNRHCPHSSPSRTLGTCAAAGIVGLDQSTAGQIPLVDKASSPFEVAADSAVKKFLESRLERPPRF